MRTCPIGKESIGTASSYISICCRVWLHTIYYLLAKVMLFFEITKSSNYFSCSFYFFILDELKKVELTHFGTITQSSKNRKVGFVGD